MILQNRERILIAVLADLLILLVGFRLIVSPAVEQFRANKAALNQLSSAWGSAVSADAQNVTELAEQSAGFFFPGLEPENAHRYLSGIIAESGGKLESIAISAESAGLPAGFYTVAVDLTVTGTQEQFLGFLRAVEAQDRAIAMEAGQLNPHDSGVSADVKLVLFCMDGSIDSDFAYTPSKPAQAGGFRFGSAS